jgi:hypothetical protein
MARPPRLMVSGPIQRQNYDCARCRARQQSGRVVCARLSRQRLALRDRNPRDVRFGSLADVREWISDVRFNPQKQTCSSAASMSAKCQKRTLDRCHGNLRLAHFKSCSWPFGLQLMLPSLRCPRGWSCGRSKRRQTPRGRRGWRQSAPSGRPGPSPGPGHG